ncbi:site-2 protease family protein [Tindallia californiensis]|uniref:Zn-dependent protease (Includes SpoIVFB) n=1 Tax=Tindallia californiensis TaxID=159292 RepID=A0A1H3NKX7_9FIRM|nr:site-2 protease family protein [Tindallia californiensis]SDY89532.1 Zn-dependent protease (includes SpoIVFB) [Tindallia californiensis]
MFNLDPARIMMILPGILIGLTIHEFSHGYTAYLLGDDTARNQGRLTLNPVAHIDPVGFFMLIFAGFGWAKPVPINPYYFTDRRKGTFLVSIAGPLSNIVMAFLLTTLLGVLMRTVGTSFAVQRIILSAVSINLVLAVFNLFPIPPLDGSKILMSLFPSRFEETFYQIEQYSVIILMILLVFGVIRNILFPIVDVLYNMLLLYLSAIVF